MSKQAQTSVNAEVSPSQHHFAHESEVEFASILNFYQVSWSYEPKTFPLLWSKEGQLTECFTPDFYLPDQRLFIELTTVKPRLMAKKRRKIKLLNELYPHIKIRLIQGRDFHQLMWKYGKQ